MSRSGPPLSTSHALGLAVLLGASTLAVGCAREEPPSRPGEHATRSTEQRANVAPPAPRAAVASAAAAPADAAPADAAPAVTAAADAATADAAPPELPALLGPDGRALPQTEARPSTGSAFFQAQSQQLFRAIAEDDPERAKSFFFPLVAYQQVKDIADPKRDHERRLLRAFERDVHAYHRRLGPQAREARWIGIEVPEKDARWMKPGSEGNKLGYYRVLRSKLRYQTAAGADGAFEITSFISWRGEWYLVHLNGFK